MRPLITLMLMLIFAGLSALHVYWACGGSRWREGAVPSTNGVAAFQPGAGATARVAVGLLLAAALVAVCGGIVHVPLPKPLFAVPALLLAMVLLARAIGDFRLVGLFKRPNPSLFAQLDTLLYSPLCALLALGILFILVER